MTAAFQATHRSRGATAGVAGSIARTSHRRTDNQPSKENASLPSKTWICAENTELGIDLFPPATEIFCKIGSARARKTPQRSRSGIYLTLSTTESTAFTECVLCTEGMARIPFGRQRHATGGRNQRGFVCTKMKLRTKSGAFVPKGSWTKKLVVGARPITLALEADRRIRIGADHLAFRRYHGGARRSLRRSGRGVMCALLCQHRSRYQRSHTDDGHQNPQSHLVASPLRPK
jgi:hypothetical protein